MIKVINDREHNRITVEGHAYSGEAGHDLICASASILLYTIAATVDRMKASGLIKDAEVDIKVGEGTVSYDPNGSHNMIIRAVLDSICFGYEILADTHPDNLSYEVNNSI